MHLNTGRRGAPNWAPNQPSVADLGSKSPRYSRQTTTEPILPSFLPTSVSVPEAFLLNPTPLNLHNCLPTGGFLQTAVSDAPLRTCPPLTLTCGGASDTALTFRMADYSGVTALSHRRPPVRVLRVWATTRINYARDRAITNVMSSCCSLPPLNCWTAPTTAWRRGTAGR